MTSRAGGVYHRRVIPALLAALALAQASPEAPFDVPGHPVTSDARSAPQRPRAPAAEAPVAFRAYEVLSRIDGPRCPHAPSCSAYALQAYRSRGLVPGAWIAAARLLRGTRSSALRPLPRDTSGRWLDPLESSTFFLP